MAQKFVKQAVNLALVQCRIHRSEIATHYPAIKGQGKQMVLSTSVSFLLTAPNHA